MAPKSPQSDVTAALAAIRDGDSAAKERLVALIYDDLRDAAGRAMRRERSDHTLQPTALVHESLLRIMNTTSLGQIQDRGHLMAAATVALKRVLIDHARARRTEKRGGGRQRESLAAALDREPDDAPVTAPPTTTDSTANPLDRLMDWYERRGLDILALDDALEELRTLHARWFDVILLRFFGGFTIERAAELLDVSARTVASDWNQARAWLQVRLAGDAHA